MKNIVNVAADFLLPAKAEANGNLANTWGSEPESSPIVRKKHIMNGHPSIPMRSSEYKYISLVISSPAFTGTERLHMPNVDLGPRFAVSSGESAGAKTASLRKAGRFAREPGGHAPGSR